MRGRSSALIIAGTAVLSTLLHLLFGWGWTLCAGVVAGVWRPRRGWVWGSGGVALGWAGLVIYTAVQAPASFRTLLDTIGTLGGNIPGEVIVGASVVLGGVLGALGGGIGASMIRLLRSTEDAAHR